MRLRTKKNFGFTLIELLIAIAIVGILAAMAQPYYYSFVMKSRRVDAINTLMQLQIEQEKYRAFNPAYADDLSKLPIRQSDSGYISQDGNYAIELTAASVFEFSIRAEPTVGGLQEKDSCRVFAINQDGPEVDTEEKRRCWNL